MVCSDKSNAFHFDELLARKLAPSADDVVVEEDGSSFRWRETLDWALEAARADQDHRRLVSAAAPPIKSHAQPSAYVLSEAQDEQSNSGRSREK